MLELSTKLKWHPKCPGINKWLKVIEQAGFH
jgi:hypothetical protein